MSGRLSPSPSHHVSQLVLSLLLLSTVTTDGNPGCLPSSCGFLNIFYPFWVVHDPAPAMSFSSYCGYQGLKITCKNNTPILSLLGDDYTVTAIDYQARTISVADPDAHRAEGCLTSYRNVALGSDSLLSYTTNDTTITFCFNCTHGPWEMSIPCPEDGGGILSFVFISDQMPKLYNWRSICGEVVEVPVLKAVLEKIINVGRKLTAAFDEVLLEGFQLQWGHESSEKCAACEKSGGWCGFNITSGSPGAFVCFPANLSEGKSGTFSDVFVVAAHLSVYTKSEESG